MGLRSLVLSCTLALVSCSEIEQKSVEVDVPSYASGYLDSLTDKSYKLSKFPEGFVFDKKFNGILVVGDNAPKSDLVAAKELMNNLVYLNKYVVLVKFDKSQLKKASEVKDIKSQNTILISTRKANLLISDYFYPSKMLLHKIGEGTIAAKTWDTGYTTIFLGAAREEDTVTAAKALKRGFTLEGFNSYAARARITKYGNVLAVAWVK